MLDFFKAQAGNRLRERTFLPGAPRRSLAGMRQNAAFATGWLLAGLIACGCAHAQNDQPTRVRVAVPDKVEGQQKKPPTRVVQAQPEPVIRTRPVYAQPEPVVHTRPVYAQPEPVTYTRGTAAQTSSQPQRVSGEAASIVATRFPIGNGAVVERGKRIASASGDHYLIFQPDGNLVVYDKNNRYLWGIDRVPNFQASESVQVEQGDLRVRDAQQRLIWAALANSPDQDAHLDLTPSGALQLVSPTRGPIWSSDQHSAPTAPVAVAAQREAPPPAVVAATTKPSSSAQTAQPGGALSGLSPVQAAVLEAHNRARAKHDVLPLKWSPALAGDAQKWADQCVHGHAPAKQMNNSGENIAYGALDQSPEWWAGRVDSMYSEIKSYRYDNPGFNKQGSSQETQTGHFTQIVWQDTTDVGCAWSRCPRAMYTSHMVCRYSPPGNMSEWGPGGEAAAYTRNVPRPLR